MHRSARPSVHCDLRPNAPYTTSPAAPKAVTTENMKVTGNRCGGTPDFTAVHTAMATKLAAPAVAIIA